MFPLSFRYETLKPVQGDVKGVKRAEKGDFLFYELKPIYTVMQSDSEASVELNPLPGVECFFYPTHLYPWVMLNLFQHLVIPV